MIPVYSQEQFDLSPSRQFLPLRCKQCSEIFQRTKHDIQIAIIHSEDRNQVHTYDFCSNRCFRSHQNPPIFIICEQCGKKVRKPLRRIKINKHHFCGLSCFGKYNMSHKTTGCRISKMERWMQERLPILFPGLEFHFNRRDQINSELDIFVPSLKLAFELNGIFHYEPIHGPKQLTGTQNNDHRKMLACAEQGIELCVIDVSSVKHFKPLKGQKYLDIISNIIRSKITEIPCSPPLFASSEYLGIPSG